jgi:hypothetical protein
MSLSQVLGKKSYPSIKYVLRSGNIADRYLYGFVRNAKERRENGFEIVFSKFMMEEQISQK